MQNTAAIQEDLVFGLDIGTRSIVGVVGFQDRKGFHVVAMAQQEHETRAMLDGQIHDIYKVGDTIRKVNWKDSWTDSFQTSVLQLPDVYCVRSMQRQNMHSRKRRE